MHLGAKPDGQVLWHTQSVPPLLEELVELLVESLVLLLVEEDSLLVVSVPELEPESVPESVPVPGPVPWPLLVLSELPESELGEEDSEVAVSVSVPLLGVKVPGHGGQTTPSIRVQSIEQQGLPVPGSHGGLHDLPQFSGSSQKLLALVPFNIKSSFWPVIGLIPLMSPKSPQDDQFCAQWTLHASSETKKGLPSGGV
ncbi:MAG: hypothetical protein V1744_02085 [Candidatus Altiarchaeota archaeon]